MARSSLLGLRHLFRMDNPVWEFSTEADYLDKANREIKKRTKEPGAFLPRDTTFVFVTPRRWNRPRLSVHEWQKRQKAKTPWRDVKVIDGIALADWIQNCPAFGASWRNKVGKMPEEGVRSTDEFWDEYAVRFEPTLREGVILSGRAKESVEILRKLMGGPDILRIRGDSAHEIIGSVIASIRTAANDLRRYLEARTLVVDTDTAGRAPPKCIRPCIIDGPGSSGNTRHVIEKVPRGFSRHSGWHSAPISDTRASLESRTGKRVKADGIFGGKWFSASKDVRSQYHRSFPPNPKPNWGGASKVGGRRHF